jgi:hypothetical protein
MNFEALVAQLNKNLATLAAQIGSRLTMVLETFADSIGSLLVEYAQAAMWVLLSVGIVDPVAIGMTPCPLETEETNPEPPAIVCEIEDDFDTEMSQYLQNRLIFHVDKTQKVIENEIEIRKLKNKDKEFFETNATQILDGHDAASMLNGQMVIDGWKEKYDGSAGVCPNVNPLYDSVSSVLTQHETVAEVGIKNLLSEKEQDTIEKEIEKEEKEKEKEEKKKGLACSLAADKENIRKGDHVRLNWHTNEAEVIELHPNLSGVDLSGSLEVTPNETTEYTLVAYDKKGNSKTCTQTVFVTAACEIWTDSVIIAQGTQTRLHWNAEGNDVVEINTLGPVGLTGTRVIEPSDTSIYDMTVYADGVKTQTCHTKVQVAHEYPCLGPDGDVEYVYPESATQTLFEEE